MEKFLDKFGVRLYALMYVKDYRRNLLTKNYLFISTLLFLFYFCTTTVY